MSLKYWLTAAVMAVLFYVSGLNEILVEMLASDPYKITWFISGFFALGLTLSLQSYWKTQREIKLTKQLAHKDFVFDAKAVPVKFRKSWFGNHLTKLMTLAEASDKEISQDKMAMHLQGQIQNGPVATVRYLVSLLVSLGFLGTLYGMVSVGTNISKVLAAVQDDSVGTLNSLSALMEGLGSAFNTTLLGVFFGLIVLKSLNWVIERERQSIFESVVAITEAKILPALNCTPNKAGEESEHMG
ncbi:MotA/TolQ/ExbB proton channel family protein [Patescibacteria group bacterium]